MEIKFISDIELDASNWQKSLQASSYGIKWSDFLPKDISIEEARDSKYLKEYLKKKYYNSGKIEEFKNWLKDNLNKESTVNDLESLMGKRFDINSIDIRITTFPRAPYNYKNGWFFVIFKNSKREIIISEIYHEMMHILFHEHYWAECESLGLNDSQISNLKESLTVVLNPILENRDLPLDEGYPKHREVREKIMKIWKEKNWKFEDFLKNILKQKIV